MPSLPPRVRPARGRGAPWARTSSPRIRGYALQQLRHRLFDEQPLCVHCYMVGRVEPATIRDHIVPLAEGGLDLEANTQALCAACHDRKSAAEAKRGSARSKL